ncbi:MULTISPECIES: galactokinase [unclassified Pseudonocardia]|uniref:galactokinase n=1 Tax=unclassified Pseudonocardia TaxID=2619320 RepID=UPI0001FFF144|nr:MULTISPECIES: galactokinase [unclassified Pseudonocardia]ALE73400.1 galactokinase [Pseudonocardia sp. EC080625-04]ALL77086.1 galactokinase [Pseudonocardia sp. EC080610-09]ALL79999.1 galactokinase [Pseudonocardia sp. EC080619-01]OLM18418.1 Galactokinase [Pseudonocardia sp. Ae707_Ps1]
MTAADAFAADRGTAPSGVWFAPGRVNLIGEHTDYNDGFVLPFALPHRAVVAAGPAGGRSRVRSAQEPSGAVEFDASTVAPGDVEGWAAYVAGTCWAFREAGHPVADLEIELDSDVPVGAGLSSSAAVECAVGVALAGLAGVEIGPTELARIARRAENEFVGAPTGGMDQMASMHGRAGRLVFLDTRDDTVELVPFELGPHGLELLVIDTRAPHAHAGGEYGQRRADCEEAAAALGVGALRDATADAVERLTDDRVRRRARHVVTENDRVRAVVELLGSGADPREIGPLLDASHTSMRDDFEITVPHVDVAVEAARAGGAAGARMTGGGFGGCVIALVPAEAAAAVTGSVERAYAERGWTAPVVFPGTPSEGAGRLS